MHPVTVFFLTDLCLFCLPKIKELKTRFVWPCFKVKNNNTKIIVW